jgi:cold shock CspA family protein
MCDNRAVDCGYRLPEGPREHGTIVAWNGGIGTGRIQADCGDRGDIFYWSILQGFRKLTVGQRVEFLRVPSLGERHMAALVVPAESS